MSKHVDCRPSVRAKIVGHLSMKIVAQNPPERMYIEYHWLHEPELDLRFGLNTLFSLGCIFTVVIVMGVAFDRVLAPCFMLELVVSCTLFVLGCVGTVR